MDSEHICRTKKAKSSYFETSFFYKHSNNSNCAQNTSHILGYPIKPLPVRNQIMLLIKLMNTHIPSLNLQFHPGKSIFHLLHHRCNHYRFQQGNLQCIHNQIASLVLEGNQRFPTHGISSSYCLVVTVY